MGWTSYHAVYYKNGKVDRKRECDSYFLEGLNEGHFKVLKSTMVGTTYYAAIQDMVKYVGKDENGNNQYEPLDESEREVWGCVFLTSVDTKNYFNFSYKDMDETEEPYSYDCPKAILDLLSPTENEYANAWRTKCRIKAKKKKSPFDLKNLPMNTIIRVTFPFDTSLFGKGDKVTLQKRKKCSSNRTAWYVVGFGIRFSQNLMKQLEDDFEIVEIGK